MTTPVELKEVRVSMMNVVHDLALVVARDEGLFRDEGLDVEIVSTPGTAQVNADHQALQAQIFDRTMEALYNTGAVQKYIEVIESHPPTIDHQNIDWDQLEHHAVASAT